MAKKERKATESEKINAVIRQGLLRVATQACLARGLQEPVDAWLEAGAGGLSLVCVFPGQTPNLVIGFAPDLKGVIR